MRTEWRPGAIRTRRDPFALLGGVLAGALLVAVLAASIEPERTRAQSGAEAVGGVGAATGATEPAHAGEPADLDASPAESASGATPQERALGDGPTARLAAAQDGPTATAGGDLDLGVLLLDLSSVQQIGFQAPGGGAEEEREAYDAFIDLVNDDGGIGGRRIVPFYRKFNPLDPDSMQAACVALAQDGKVFAAIAGPGFFNQHTLCLTERFGIPTISFQPESEEWQHRTRGLLVTQYMTTHRMLRTLVHVAEQQGRFTDKTIGIVTSKAPADLSAVEAALEPALARLGHKVAHKSVLHEQSSQGASQLPVEILEMRRNGVDLVIFATNAIYFGMWANEAEGQQFQPLYLASDVGFTSDDFAVQNAPTSLKALAYTAARSGEYRLNRPEPAPDADCHRRYRQQTGKTLDRTEQAGYVTAVRACGFIDLFAAAARRAAGDPSLTREGFVRVLRTLGPWDQPNSGPGSLQPDKLGIADSVRTKQYRGNCRCWIPIDEFIPAPR